MKEMEREEKKTTRRVHGITYGTNPRGGAKGKRKEKKRGKKRREKIMAQLKKCQTVRVEISE